MKLFKKIALGFVALIALLVLGIFGYYVYKAPQYEGTAEVAGLTQETQVYFDDYGVPHIYAQNQVDAMRALGYVHAQDRLWQMELMRRIAPGRLSELFGSKALENDRFFAGLGIDENSAAAAAVLDKKSKAYQLAQAYLDGVNQYIDEGKTPIEFDLVGVNKEPFTLKDMYNIFGYMSFSFAMAQKTDPLLTDIRDAWGMNYLSDFGLDGALAKTRLQSYDGKSKDYAQISKAVTALLEQSPVPPFIGSNSWVIGAEKTKNQKVIFANDPHIMFSQPGTWYEAHISCPGYEMYGYYLAGTPFPLLGHNRNYAYGLTMFENDDLDLFQEENHPQNAKQYKTATGYAHYSIRTKTIKVKDTSDVHLTLKSTQHGPIMNGLLKGLHTKNPVAMSWIYTQHPNHILEAVYGLSHAQGLDDFYQKVGLVHAPGLNVMYGDAKNNIGWITSGKLYRMPAGVNPNFILNGANGKDDQRTFLPFESNPRAINPDWHYVYSANNQPEPIDDYLYPGYYLPQDRAKRIQSLLATKNNWERTDVERMINDHTSLIYPNLVKNWMQSVSKEKLTATEKSAMETLQQWEGSHAVYDIAPTIYNKWLYCYLKNTFQDELGEERFSLFLGTHMLKQMIAGQSMNPKSPWWDNVKTKGITETRNQIMERSFHEAIQALEKQLGPDYLQWRWGKVHTVEHQHPLGRVSMLRPFFNVGPFEVPGSNEVINNLMFYLADTGNYKVGGGPSTRRIIDFSDVENSVSILPTGQSGVLSSQHYNDQAELYVKGRFRKMKLNRKEIEETATLLVLKPKRM
jgi:penicillin amidase